MGLIDFILDQKRRGDISDIATGVQSGQIQPNEALLRYAMATGDPEAFQAGTKQSALARLYQMQQQPRQNGSVGDTQPDQPIPQTLPDQNARAQPQTRSALPPIDALAASGMFDPLELTKLAQQNALVTAKIGNLSEKNGLPATIQIVNAMQEAKASGDMERYNMLNLVHKTMDRGVSIDPATGGAVPMAGYGAALGDIAATKSGMSRQAEKTVDAQMNPIIAGGEAESRLRQQLNYEPSIKQATDIAAGQAKAQTDLAVDAKNASKSNEILDRVELLLPKASGGAVGNLIASAKGAANYSDESTRANTQLKTLSGWLTSSVPRMQGPQSDKDTQLYKEMAASVGDINIPTKDRHAAMQELRRLNAKYAHLNQTGGTSPLSSMSLEDLKALRSRLAGGKR